MKTNLFLLGMAVAALSSCTNEELTDVAQNRAIKFNPFVENNTKAVQEVSSLNSYYLFGEFKQTTDSYTGTNNVFDNEPSSVTQYWSASKDYSFGAYADGDGGKLDGATFNAVTSTLTFPSYTVDDAKDLVAATATHQTDDNVSNESEVGLTFKHMLSQVKFTFTTTDAENYTLKISELTFTAVNQATGTYTNDVIDWSTSPSNGSYAYDEINDIAEADNYKSEISKYQAETNSKLVIPQSSTDQITVTFKATISGPGMDEKEATFTADLGVAEKIAGENSAANTWVPGYRYNYTAEINAAKIDPTLEQQKIEFTTSVDSWQNATNTDKEPTTKP